jgi:2-haloacid dehalogenase
MTIRACLFDAYGTLFDVHSAIGRYKLALGTPADELSALWRTKQLEYTWLRSLMKQYADFWQVTEEALRYAFAAYGIEDGSLFKNLMQAYLTLTPCPDVVETLKILKERGIGRHILSNGSPMMLTSAVNYAGIGELLDGVVSVGDGSGGH